jgi:hypothetical protein
MNGPPDTPPVGLFSRSERDEYQTAGPKRRATMISRAEARLGVSAIDAKRYTSHAIKPIGHDDDDDGDDLGIDEPDDESPPNGVRPVNATTEWRRQRRWLDTYREFRRQGVGDENAVARTNAIVTPDGLWRRRCICGLEFLAKRRTAKYAPGHDRCRKRVDQERFDPASRVRWNRP